MANTVKSDAQGMDRVSSGATLADREQAMADLINKR
jgi:hypothetical protein